MADDVKNEPKIVVNGNEHLLTDLSDEQKKMVKLCESLAIKIQKAEMDLEELRGASKFFADNLISSFKETKEEKTE